MVDSMSKPHTSTASIIFSSIYTIDQSGDTSKGNKYLDYYVLPYVSVSIHQRMYYPGLVVSCGMEGIRKNNYLTPCKKYSERNRTGGTA
jgi:hypothetical protein